MFAKLLEGKQLDSKEQKEVLKSILTTNLKQNLAEVRLQFNHNYTKLKPVLIKHYKYSFRLALALHSWQVALQMLQGKQQKSNATDLLYSLLEQDTAKRGWYLVTELSKSYTDCWRLLVVLQLASNIAKYLQTSLYGHFLAIFIKLSAAAIQSYLTIKNQPATSSEDRLESDSKLLASCQKWVTRAFTTMIGSLKQPKVAQQRQSTLIAFSQIVGALLQNQRGSQLSVQKLTEIERAAGSFVIGHFSLQQIGDTYLVQLKSGGYSARLKKIQVPQQYDNRCEFAKEGVCWLLLLALRETQGVYSQENLLKWYYIALSQSLESPLPIKEEALAVIKRLRQRKIDCQTLEKDYPISLLLFNVYKNLNGELNYFRNCFNIGSDHSVDLRRWRRLLNIDLGAALNVDKITFVLSQITEEAYKQKELLLLVKALKFDFTSEQLMKDVENLLQQANKQEESKRVLAWLLDREVKNGRNVEFCDRLRQSI